MPGEVLIVVILQGFARHFYSSTALCYTGGCDPLVVGLQTSIDVSVCLSYMLG